MGDMLDIAHKLRVAKDQLREVRAQRDALEELLNERDNQIFDLLGDLAAKDRLIDALEAFPVARRDGL